VIIFFALCLGLDKNCRSLQHNLLSGSIAAQLVASQTCHPTQQVALIVLNAAFAQIGTQAFFADLTQGM
jgi:hypothetical protein